ncbi:GrpB family protein [Nocardiopsis composta]|uniref:GrpB family protein n=1 Tax=Nocardiopsis composta TaxID=157465 RepID=UPI0035E40D5B
MGELRPHDGPVVVADYDPEWPRLFEREAERIRGALGGRALMVEHVGSTSVPGLAAKPVIDVLLAVADSADEPAYLPELESAGYVLRIREPDWFEHRLFKGPDTDVNLHVFTAGAEEADRMLRFRDRLRADPADRERYAAAKRDLARRTWRYVQDYADAKTGIVQEIMRRAGAAGGGEAGGDVVDPAGGFPSLWFQATESTAPDRQRFHLDVTVPPEAAEQRIAAALAAGGRVVDDGRAPAFTVLADPDGNNACICTELGRD